MNGDINKYVPSILNPRCVKKNDLSLTQNSIVSRSSLSLKRNNVFSQRNNIRNVACSKNVPSLRSIDKVNGDKENWLNNLIEESQENKNVILTRTCSNKDSLGISAIEDLLTQKKSSPFSFGDLDEINSLNNLAVPKTGIDLRNKPTYQEEESPISVSSATEIYEQAESDSTLVICADKPLLNVSFGVNNCNSVDVTAKNGAIRRFVVTHCDNNTNVDCEVQEISQASTETKRELDEDMNETSSSPLKRSAVAVNLEIKKQKLSETDRRENSKVLILNTNAIEKISHVIVQPSNYRFVKRNLPINKFKSNNKRFGDGSCAAGLKQLRIDSFFRQCNVSINSSDKYEDAEEMSRNSGVNDAVKCERVTRSAKVYRRVSANETPKSARQKREPFSPRRDVKASNSEAPPSPTRVGSLLSPRQNVESLHFKLPPANANTIKKALSPRSLPYHKIVAGTHFAVDAFSYGDIPNVKHYFLTHFHSDHYAGLKKSFNKLLFCSKITADLCISRLGVNSKYIHVIAIDETLRIDGSEVTAVDANHCPGALMLVFSLPNGKTILHTGDFRACPSMESYPVFWNRDIHTVYLDTTYCNPRYDFPTQDQSLEMAVYILRQKKMVLEKAGKKFASVLIVCGTYTIGKEKFFLGMSRRVGCSVWACPEKERVLQTVEGKASSREAPHACQLHVVPMRDLTHEKLRNYLDSMQGAFTEVVAFKPSGWETGKNVIVEKDGVTIHGIPYSEHSSFSELVRFVKFLKPKQVVPTVDISGGAKTVQKYFPCPLVYKDELLSHNKMSDYFSIQTRQLAAAVT